MIFRITEPEGIDDVVSYFDFLKEGFSPCIVVITEADITTFPEKEKEKEKPKPCTCRLRGTNIHGVAYETFDRTLHGDYHDHDSGL